MLKRVRQMELEMLRYVDRICSDNGLKYYLVGGTLLGAIRHGGFIPWDDDIDIAMYREDYNRFLEIVSSDRNSKYFVQNFRTDRHYSRYITKLRVNGTRFVEESVKDVDMHHGIFIDIFPLDRISMKNEMVIDLRAKLAEKVIRARSIKLGRVQGATRLRTYRNQVVKTLLVVVPLPLFSWVVDFLYSFSNRKDAEFTTSFGSQYGWKKQAFRNEIYGAGTPVMFEGYYFNAPQRWDIVLSQLYGNFMELPPPEKRHSGHEIVEISLGQYSSNN